ncbi:hypothetical protein [Sphingobium yanoikuyae]|uniref:hypothetical protein n=1 Tax=Sphingobium yanoikuyae TaxID=13690 RepID=UPI001F3BA110|nr:hypothetical protein [Sphingobium yanoikuyae]
MSKAKSKPATADQPGFLSFFPLDPAKDGSFKYIRYFYKQDVHRAGIADMVMAKLTPAGHQASRHDLLLPDAASGEYMDLNYLLQRYDASCSVVEVRIWRSSTRNGSASLQIHW